MTIRKSNRVRTLTSKVKDLKGLTNNLANEPPVKKRKLEKSTILDEEIPIDDDRIDPVEKLLSLTTVDNDFLNIEEQFDYPPPAALTPSSSTSSSNNNISLNFTKIINENIRNHYSNLKRCPIEIHNDHSLFSVLNHKKQQVTTRQETKSKSQTDVPFFRNVNFNPKPQSAYTFDEYLSYDDDIESETSSSSSSPIIPANKMSFHYRHNDNLNLSPDNSNNYDSHDILKYLNKRLIIAGKASEMVSTGNFLINDFFL